MLAPALISNALRLLRVVAHDEPATGEQVALGLDHYTALLADLNGPWGGCTLAFTAADAVPEAYRWPLESLLANRLAPIYDAVAPMAETTALMRVRAVNKPFVRDMDLDDSGTTSDGEIISFDEGRFY